MYKILPLVLVLALLQQSAAWMSTNCFPPRSTAAASSSTRLFGIETVTLTELTDHEAEGTMLAESIARWLDQEWIPQEVHIKMGESAKASYIQMREAGEDDVMDIMMQISGDLEKNWQEYDADAFVNAYDIANYASDYLVKRSGGESCACSSEIF